MISKEDRRKIHRKSVSLQRLEELEKAFGYVDNASLGTENIWPTHIKLCYGTCVEYECKLGYGTKIHEFIKELLKHLIKEQESKICGEE